MSRVVAEAIGRTEVEGDTDSKLFGIPKQSSPELSHRSRRAEPRYQ